MILKVRETNFDLNSESFLRLLSCVVTQLIDHVVSCREDFRKVRLQRAQIPRAKSPQPPPTSTIVQRSGALQAKYDFMKIVPRKVAANTDSFPARSDNHPRDPVDRRDAGSNHHARHRALPASTMKRHWTSGQ